MVRRSMRVGTMVGMAAAALTVGALAGCGPTDDGSAAGKTSGPATPSGVPANTGSSTGTSTEPSTVPSAVASPPPGPSAQAVTACRKGVLSVKLAGESAGSGHRSVTIVFVNTGRQPCTLHGYPGVAALDAGGKQVAQAARTEHGYLGGLPQGTGATTVTLRPGGSASAIVEALAFRKSDGSACPAYRGLLVTAPGDVASTRLSWTTDSCDQLEVHPVVARSAG
jgi:hypothetical protein